MTHKPLTEAQLGQSQDWADLNATPYPVGAYLETIREAQTVATKWEREAIGLRDHLERVSADGIKRMSELAEAQARITRLAANREEILRQWTLSDEARDKAATEAQARIATLEAENARLKGAIAWALGEVGEFPERRMAAGRYWWRRELRERSSLSSTAPPNPSKDPKAGDL